MKFSGKYYEGIHKVRPINREKLLKFQEILEDEKCNVFSKISIIQRIGSPSLYATIWEINFILDESNGIKMAVKVQKGIDKTLQEIDINKYLNLYPTYFLQMYGSIYCQNISIPNLKDPSSYNTFEGYFIFMELAIADLAQLLTLTKVTEDELRTIISQVFDSIYIMGKLQLFHGDLHIRNIFIVPRENTIRAVIGDFGETIGIDSITSHTSDIYRFATSLLEFLKTNKSYTTIKVKIENIVKYVNRLTIKLEEDYDNFNEKNRDEDGNIDLNLLDLYFDNVVKNTIETIKKMI